jgi:hypothetical protein
MLAFGGYGGIEQGFGIGVVALDASQDNVTWDSIATPSEVLGNILPYSYASIAAISFTPAKYRYWRVTFSVYDPGTELHYFRGYDFTFLSLYEATAL